MSIKSTQIITRRNAIERISYINSLIVNKNYRQLEADSFESSAYDVIDCVGDGQPLSNIEHIEKWTNKMLGSIMDRPFYRFSMFDNYWVEGKKVDNFARV